VRPRVEHMETQKSTGAPDPNNIDEHTKKQAQKQGKTGKYELTRDRDRETLLREREREREIGFVFLILVCPKKLRLQIFTVTSFLPQRQDVRKESWS
jgi:hypothetical protein